MLLLDWPVWSYGMPPKSLHQISICSFKLVYAAKIRYHHHYEQSILEACENISLDILVEVHIG